MRDADITSQSRFADVPEGLALEKLLGDKSELSGVIDVEGTGNVLLDVWRSTGDTIDPEGDDIIVELCLEGGRVARFLVDVTGAKSIGLTPEVTLDATLKAMEAGITPHPQELDIAYLNDLLGDESHLKGRMIITNSSGESSNVVLLISRSNGNSIAAEGVDFVIEIHDGAPSRPGRVTRFIVDSVTGPHPDPNGLPPEFTLPDIVTVMKAGISPYDA